MSEREKNPVVGRSLLQFIPDVSLLDLTSFNLGMDEWTQPSAPPKKRLSLSFDRDPVSRPLQDATNKSRFAKPVDSATLHEAAKGVIPAKTEASTRWAVSTFLCLHLYICIQLSVVGLRVLYEHN